LERLGESQRALPPVAGLLAFRPRKHVACKLEAWWNQTDCVARGRAKCSPLNRLFFWLVQAGEYVIEDTVMEKVDRILSRVDKATELEVLSYVA
jgi:hypothetical protein